MLLMFVEVNLRGECALAGFIGSMGLGWQQHASASNTTTVVLQQMAKVAVLAAVQHTQVYV